MEQKDRRRPLMEHGLGIVVEKQARFYPLRAVRAGIVDDWSGRILKVFVQDEDQMPAAEWPDGTRPWQIFTRWYGFSLTYRGCEIYGERPSDPGSSPGRTPSGS